MCACMCECECVCARARVCTVVRACARAFVRACVRARVRICMSVRARCVRTLHARKRMCAWARVRARVCAGVKVSSACDVRPTGAGRRGWCRDICDPVREIEGDVCGRDGLEAEGGAREIPRCAAVQGFTDVGIHRVIQCMRAMARTDTHTRPQENARKPTARSRTRERAAQRRRSLGADLVIDYKETDFERVLPPNTNPIHARTHTHARSAGLIKRRLAPVPA